MLQLLIAAGHAVQKALPDGGGGFWIVVYPSQAGDETGAVMGVQGSIPKFEYAIAYIECPACLVKIVVSGRNAGKMLGFFEQIVLGMAAAAFLNEFAQRCGLLWIMDAEQPLFHAVQHLVTQLLDGGGLVPAPDLPCPQHPAALCVVVAHPVAVQVPETPCVAGIVQAVGFAPRGGGGWRKLRLLFFLGRNAHAAQKVGHFRFGFFGRGFRQRGGAWIVDFLAVGQGAGESEISVGICPAPLVPLFAVEAAGPESRIHARLVGAQPEGQQVAKG